MNNFNINEAGGFRNFIQYIEKNKSLPYFEEKEEGVLVPIPFPQFEELNNTEKQKVYEKLEGIIKQIEELPIPPLEDVEPSLHDSPFKTLKDFPIPSDQTLSKIIQARNAIFYSLHKPAKESSIPKEIIAHFQAFTTPEDIQSASSVSKQWEKGGPDARAQHINQGIALKSAIPPQIKTAAEAIEWLEKNVNCKALTYADFTDLKDFDFDDNNLKELIEICPNLTHLFINSDKITKIEELPAQLQVLFCGGCRNLNQLPALPATLQLLDCGWCPLNQLPALPAALQKLYCGGCNNLKELPALPDVLQELYCNGCPNLNQLPVLPAALQTLYCEGCPNLIEIPALPAALQKLNCWRCANLNQLPEFPDALQVLDCHGCPNLKELPALPAALQTLDCRGCDNFNELPALPAALQELNCSVCPNLIEIPALPAALQKLNCWRCDNLNQLPNFRTRCKCLTATGAHWTKRARRGPKHFREETDEM